MYASHDERSSNGARSRPGDAAKNSMGTVTAYRHTLGNDAGGSSSLAPATGRGLIITSGSMAWENSFAVQ
jgi:hypothetical protein